MTTDWGSNGGTLCGDCCVCEPCCGSPCNAGDGMYCFLNALCCSSCVSSKMWASSMDHPKCGLFNHFAVWFVALLLASFAVSGADPSIVLILSIPATIGTILTFYLRTVLRLNQRRKLQIGDPACNFMDCFIPSCPCTTACDMCQLYRSMPVSEWDWLSQVRATGIETTTADFTLSARPPNPFGTPGSKHVDDFDEEIGQTFEIHDADTGLGAEEMDTPV